MRKRPSAATVLAVVALFVSLSGTAMAAIIISKNSQVAAHTIAGANGPSGDNKNIISGSVGSSDLHTGAVTGSKLANGAVTTSKLHLPKIDYSSRDTDPNNTAPHHTVLKLEGLTLGVACYFDSGAVQELLFASSTSSKATLRGAFIFGDPNTGGTPVIKSLSLSSTPKQVFFVSPAPGEVFLSEGVLTYRDTKRVITVSLDGVDNHDAGKCSLDGMAVPAPN